MKLQIFVGKKVHLFINSKAAHTEIAFKLSSFLLVNAENFLCCQICIEIFRPHVKFPNEWIPTAND